MNALIQVSDLKYDTNNGTILSVDIKIDSQSFHVELNKDHKYIVKTNVESLVKGEVKLIAPDNNPVVEVKADIANANNDNKKTNKKTDNKNTKPDPTILFVDNDDLIKKLEVALSV